MRDLWLIRHAESVANIGESTSTPREIPLSEKGREQADRLSESIPIRPDLVILSPYARTRQTAEPFFELYPDVKTETLSIQEFTYLSVSRCRGTNFEQRKPWVREYWRRTDPDYCDGDQSESFAEFIERCERFSRNMRDRDFERAFVFTHEQFIKGLLWSEMGLGHRTSADTMSSFQKFMVSFSIPNASVTRWKIDVDGSSFFGKIDCLGSRI